MQQRAWRLWLRHVGSSAHLTGSALAIILVGAMLGGMAGTASRQVGSNWPVLVLAAYATGVLLSSIVDVTRGRRPQPQLSPEAEAWLARRRLAALRRSWDGSPLLRATIGLLGSLPDSGWLRIVNATLAPLRRFIEWRQERSTDWAAVGEPPILEQLRSLQGRLAECLRDPENPDAVALRILDSDLPAVVTECKRVASPDLDQIQQWSARLSQMRNDLRR